MTETKGERGFFGKLFGGKGRCCSVQIEEITETQEPKSVQVSENEPAKKACDAGQSSKFK
ncbi:MAG: hypothetical protein C4519_13350 [Desulfobacteraceae bacterium]|nr:MAG: hypothetical protein C4519_13350 [Desulfobacteraceae bacterium]